MTLRWDTRIDRAEARGGFTAKDIGDAESWRSCAVGENARRCKYDPYKVVDNDEILMRDGGVFATHVSHNSFARARKCYERITKRFEKLMRRVERDSDLADRLAAGGASCDCGYCINA